MKIAGTVVNAIALLGAVCSGALMVVLGYTLLDSVSSDDQAAGVVVMILAFFAAAPPILGILLSRSSKKGRQVFGLVLGIVWNLMNIAAAFLFLGFISAAAIP